MEMIKLIESFGTSGCISGNLEGYAYFNSCLENAWIELKLPHVTGFEFLWGGKWSFGNFMISLP